MNEPSRQYETYRISFDPERMDITGFKPKKPSHRINLILFLLTILTTLIAGTLMAGENPFTHPGMLYKGVPFSFTLLFILGVHELGHYYAAKRWGMQTSLPYFIPVPPPFMLGTMGAFIKMKSPIVNRKALIDIGAAGPIAGFVASIIAVFVGLRLSTIVEPSAVTDGSIILGESLLFSLLSKAALGVQAADMEIMLHPVAFAGWIGFFITVLNLLPIGQSDGGHIVYAFLGKKQETLAKAVFAGLLPLGYFMWFGWFIMGGLFALLSRFRHPAPLDSISPLDGKRKVIGVVTLLIFVICFMPAPFKI